MNFKMPQLIKLITVFLLGICAMFSWQLCNDLCKEEIVQTHVEKIVPTVKELQRSLLTAGFDLGPKGVDGKPGGYNSYTQKAWRRAINCQRDIRRPQ